jgi:hypothetical protein
MICLRAAWFAAVLVTATAPLSAQGSLRDLPHRRPGHWEVLMMTEKPADGPSVTAQMCIDAATDRELMEFGLKMSKGTCKRFDVARAGAAWVIDAECAFGPVTSVTRTTISGDFQSRVTVRIEGTTDGIPGAGDGAQPTVMTQTATWKDSACADGMKPGDVSLGNGLKMNVKHLRKLQKMLPNIQIR